MSSPLFAQNYLNYLNEGYEDIISELNENNLIWEDPGAKAVLVFSNLKYKLHFGFYLALFLLAVVTTALLVVVFKQNFIDNKDMVKALIKESVFKPIIIKDKLISKTSVFVTTKRLK